MDSEKDSEEILTGGNSSGAEFIRLGPSSIASLSRSIDRPSSVDNDIRGGSSVTGVISPVNGDKGDDGGLSGTGGGTEENEVLIGDMEVPSPCVLLLNLEGKGGGGFQDIVLSLLPKLPIVEALIILCLAVRSKTFFSVKGKYSAKCVVMSSLGGLCPKKLRNLFGLFWLGLRRPEEPFGEAGGSRAFSG